METQLQEHVPEEKPGEEASRSSSRRFVLISSAVGLLVVLGVVFAFRLAGGHGAKGEFTAKLQSNTSTTEVLTFLASSVHGRSGVMSVELSDQDRKLVVTFDDVGRNSAACALMRDSYHRRDILEDFEVSFSPASCT